MLCTSKRMMNANDKKSILFLRYYPNTLREELMITTKILRLFAPCKNYGTRGTAVAC